MTSGCPFVTRCQLVPLIVQPSLQTAPQGIIQTIGTQAMSRVTKVPPCSKSPPSAPLIPTTSQQSLVNNCTVLRQGNNVLEHCVEVTLWNTDCFYPFSLSSVISLQPWTGICNDPAREVRDTLGKVMPVIAVEVNQPLLSSCVISHLLAPDSIFRNIPIILNAQCHFSMSAAHWEGHGENMEGGLDWRVTFYAWRWWTAFLFCTDRRENK